MPAFLKLDSILQAGLDNKIYRHKFVLSCLVNFLSSQLTPTTLVKSPNLFSRLAISIFLFLNSSDSSAATDPFLNLSQDTALIGITGALGQQKGWSTHLSCLALRKVYPDSTKFILATSCLMRAM